MIISENEVLKRQFKNDLLNGNVVPHSSVIQFLCFNPKKFKLIFSLRPCRGGKFNKKIILVLMVIVINGIGDAESLVGEYKE